MKIMPLLLVVLVIAFIGPLNATAGDPPQARLLRHLALFAEDNSLQQANWSFYVRDITSGQDILARQADHLLVPASTQKLVTTATAAMILGHDHRFETQLAHDGHIDSQGVLRGNLYIVGGGDPAFGATQLDDSLSLENVFVQWVSALREAGVTAVDGHVIADASVFDDEMVPRRYLWEDVGNYFGAGASGLSVNENEYTVYFDGGDALGQPARVVYTDPFIPGMELVNEVLTGPAGSGDRVYIFGGPFIPARRLTGTVPLASKSFPVRGSMHDPPLLVAGTFLEYLAGEAGIETSGLATSLREASHHGIIPAEERYVLHTWHAPDFFHIIYRANLASVNTYTENLVKTLGHEVGGEGSYDAGLEVIRDYWSSQHTMEPPLRFLQDGSGLSPANRLSARQLMTVMEAASHHPSFPLLINSLPLAGYSGSLAMHLRNTSSEGRLRAKSGFLSQVMAYAGYTPMQNGNLAAFVIIINHYEGSPAAMRQKIMPLLNTIAEHDGSPLWQ